MITSQVRSGKVRRTVGWWSLSVLLLLVLLLHQRMSPGVVADFPETFTLLANVLTTAHRHYERPNCVAVLFL